MTKPVQPPLPVEHALPELLEALGAEGVAVLQAPPGAGKTTRIPLALLEAGFAAGRTVMLEPRRLAARAAAERMAHALGETVGQTIGYRMRAETRVSAATRIEVVTEGVLTRMLLDDPALAGIGTLIFDEFHERSLAADLGLALAWEARAALRPDLRILVMSATLDAAPVAEMLQAPIITAEGRAFPVETVWLDRPVPRGRRFEDVVADLIRTAVRAAEGGILAFLPGAAEIRRVAQRIEGLSGCVVRPLYGALPPALQRAAILPAEGARKVVLATSIAETSLTIEDVRVVVDGGLARRQMYHPGSGMSRLVTERVSRAEADQRRGRAGRVAPGTCYRLWTRGQEGGLQPFPLPEIAAADLAGLALDLALWGTRDGNGLAFLMPPPQEALAEAQALLRQLGMLDAAGAPTAHGRMAAGLPLHPRLAHMLLVGGPAAAPVAVALEAGGAPGGPTDIGERLKLAGEAERAEARRLRRALARRGAAREAREPTSLGALTALAYPDRVALRRPGDAPRWLTAGGKGVTLSPEDPLADIPLLAVAETDGRPRDARIRSAAPLSERELRALFPERIETMSLCRWDRRAHRVVAVRQERLAALVLSEQPWSDAPSAAVADAMIDGVRTLGLPWSDAARRFRGRVTLARADGADLPDLSDAALMATMDRWLVPHLGGVRTAEAWRSFDLLPALEATLDWGQRQALERSAPAVFETPLGRRVPIDYSGEAPAVAVRLQEVFGVTRQPRVAGRPLRFTLLSPAGRPVQVTTDLPGFWASSYADVRRDLRGRYPKHPWPADPASAAPTTRARSRG